MAPLPPRIFTIAPDLPFLDVLARAVLSGFPRGPAPPDPLAELPRWTILLPTRRAVRELEQMFQSLAGGTGCLLPRIRPIGDIDEDVLPADMPDAVLSGVADAVSASGRELILISLIDQWAEEHPEAPLAAEIAAAPARAQALAASLGEFVDGLETEEVDGARIQDLFGREAARHREAILDFLAIAQRRLPEQLARRGLLGAKERQSRILLHEARRLAEHPPRGPVIAAGSTGSLPATRALLKAIARLPQGAVVLPGLDLGLDEASWTAAGPQHPQFLLKQLLTSLGAARSHVVPLAHEAPMPRAALARQLMRPPDTSDRWRAEILSQGAALAAGLTRLATVECADRPEESLTIALMLREALETPGLTASLITPDRDLARRVKQDLKRWAIDIDDSAGEPLIKSGGAAFAGLLLDAVDAGFTADTLNALFHHPLCRFDLDAETVGRAVAVIDLALFRSGGGLGAVTTLAAALERARAGLAARRHPHPAFASLIDADWQAAAEYLGRAAVPLAALQATGMQAFALHFTALITSLEAMAGPELYGGEEGERLRQLLATLAQDAGLARPCGLGRVTAFLRRHLTLTAFRPQRGLTPRLAILGLLEARLMRADIHILGGLNEATWPALPDSGPWLNRPMRAVIGLPLPERAIGQTAHDFVQALGAADVRLTWSRRVGDSPVIPSRWVLRLAMMARHLGEDRQPSSWLRLARALDARVDGKPCDKPRAAPPVAMRPRRLSVTQIEKLIRDPYAIYAAQVLRLQPLDEISNLPSPALRGTLYHAAIGAFLAHYPRALPDDPLTELLRLARPLFAAHADLPLVAALWWPRFVTMARWLAGEEVAGRGAIDHVHAEAGGRLDIETAAGPFLLTGQADRIDCLRDGTARIVDYKTGTVPTKPQIESGLAPQLPLEAAMLARGAFAAIGRRRVSELQHVKLGSGQPPGKIIALEVREPPATLADRTLAGLQVLLAGYADPLQPYVPRAIMERDEDEGSHDHLSRYREWSLAGGDA